METRPLQENLSNAAGGFQDCHPEPAGLILTTEMLPETNIEAWTELVTTQIYVGL